jgi:hypothetical protein
MTRLSQGNAGSNERYTSGLSHFQTPSLAPFNRRRGVPNRCTHALSLFLKPGFDLIRVVGFDASQVINSLPKAKSKTRSKQNKDMHKCSSVYSERGAPLPVLTSSGE